MLKLLKNCYALSILGNLTNGWYANGFKVEYINNDNSNSGNNCNKEKIWNKNIYNDKNKKHIVSSKSTIKYDILYLVNNHDWLSKLIYWI